MSYAVYCAGVSMVPFARFSKFF